VRRTVRRLAAELWDEQATSTFGVLTEPAATLRRPARQLTVRRPATQSVQVTGLWYRAEVSTHLACRAIGDVERSRCKGSPGHVSTLDGEWSRGRILGENCPAGGCLALGDTDADRRP
jgi:hypothetical protein